MLLFIVLFFTKDRSLRTE